MAEGCDSKKGLYSSLSSGSDVVYDFYCEPCRDDGINVEAEGYCQDCDEYLCGECYSVHRKPRQTRYHRLLNKDSMPKATPMSLDRVSKDISTTCKFHCGEPVKFYCKAHNFFGCSACFATTHKDCPDIESIFEKAGSVLESQEYTDFIQTLDSLATRSRDITNDASASINKSNACFSEINKSVLQLKEQVIATMDKLYKYFIAEVETLRKEETVTKLSISATSETITNTIECIRAEIEHLKSSKRLCQLYILLRKKSEEIQSLQARVLSAEETFVDQEFTFEPDVSFQQVLIANAFGKITRKARVAKKRPVEAKQWIPAKASHVADIIVKMDNDENNCWISGSALVDPGRLVIVDKDNCNVKLISTNTGKLMSALEVYSPPQDITIVDRNQVAVTLPGRKKILFLEVADTLRMTKEIDVSGSCYSVAFIKDILLVTYVYPHAKLVFIDMHGNVIKTITQDKVGKRLFKWPENVCVSGNGEKIYISDSCNNEVISLSFDGDVVNHNRNSGDLKAPKYMCVDQYGNVYVCGRDSRNVHVFNADLTQAKVILTQRDGFDSGVLSVSICHKTNRLYVGTGRSTCVKVFQLS